MTKRNPSPLAIGSHIRDRKRRQKFKKQRINRGYSDFDLCDMDGFLLELIPAMLEDLRNKTDVTPYDMDADTYLKWIDDTAKKFRQVSEALDDFDLAITDGKEYRGRINATIKDAFDSLSQHFFSLWF